MPNETMKITIPLAILIMLITIIVSFFGWAGNKTLTDINVNITQLGIKIDKLTDVRYEHETRINLLEEKAKQNSEEILKIKKGEK